MLFALFKGYHSIRDAVSGSLSHAAKQDIWTWMILFVVQLYPMQMFDVRMNCWQKCIMTHRIAIKMFYRTLKRKDSFVTIGLTAIPLFREILKGVGRKPENGEKGGIKAHGSLDKTGRIPEPEKLPGRNGSRIAPVFFQPFSIDNTVIIQ